MIESKPFIVVNCIWSPGDGMTAVSKWISDRPSPSSGFAVSSPSRATLFPPRRRWLGTAGPSTTGRCRSQTSPSLRRASSRSTPTPSLSTPPWWERRCPTDTPPAWWSSRSPETSPTTQVRGCCKLPLSLPHERGGSSAVIVSGMRDDRHLLSLPIIGAGVLVWMSVCAADHFLWRCNRTCGGVWWRSRMGPPTLVCFLWGRGA